MVEVRIRQDSRHRLSSFSVKGHADYAKGGTDVVCAAVSAVLQAAWLGLEEVAKVEITATRRRGRLELAWPESVRSDPRVDAIVTTAARSVERIAGQFPTHVRVLHEEVSAGGKTT